MRDVGVISFAQRTAVKDRERNEVEFVIPVVQEAVAASGIARHDIGFTISGSCDYLSGGPFTFVAGLDAAIAEWTRGLPAAEAEAILEGADVPCSRLYDMADAVADPHFQARKLVMSVQDPLIGEVRHPAAPFRFDGVAPEAMVRWAGPAVGQHNDHVFNELLREEAKP